MQPYPWWTLYLEPPFCVRFGILHLTTWLKWGSLFLFKIQSSKVFENWFFQLLARSWFWWQLVSIQNSSKKVFKNWFFQLLARSWFWWQLVSIQNSTLKKYYKFDVSSFWHSLGFSGSFFPVKIQFKKVLKIHFPAFGAVLVLAAAFFCKKTAKKYKKDTSSKRSHTLGEPYT